MLTSISGALSKTEYCRVTLKELDYQAFVYAVKNHYWYQMYIDDLPIWGKGVICQYGVRGHLPIWGKGDLSRVDWGARG